MAEGRVTHKADFYSTPVDVVERFFGELARDIFSLDPTLSERWEKNPLVALDPCAGGDQFTPMPYPLALQRQKLWSFPKILTVDIRKDSRAQLKANYLNVKVGVQPDLIITNPPFCLGMAIIQKALQEVREGGLVIMLLRVGFLGSQDRSEFFRQNVPIAVYVHSKRISFHGSGGTDMTEYMHCVWQKGSSPRFSQLRLIF